MYYIYMQWRGAPYFCAVHESRVHDYYIAHAHVQLIKQIADGRMHMTFILRKKVYLLH